MLWQRVLSALVLIPLALAVIKYGGWLMIIVLALLILLAQWELHNMLSNLKYQLTPILNGIGSMLFLIAAVYNAQDFGLILSLILAAYLGTLVFRYPSLSIADLSINLLVVLYTGWLFTQLYLLRTLSTPNGFFFLLFLLLCNWASDTAAYFTGSYLGRTKLAPQVSPKKTVEGAVGGVLGAALTALAMIYLTDLGNTAAYVFLGALIGAVGQIGDLAESVIKRFTGTKDSSNLIPGHGGILDRFDSVLLTAPLAYYFIKYLIV